MPVHHPQRRVRPTRWRRGELLPPLQGSARALDSGRSAGGWQPRGVAPGRNEGLKMTPREERIEEAKSLWPEHRHKDFTFRIVRGDWVLATPTPESGIKQAYLWEPLWGWQKCDPETLAFQG